MKNRIRKFFLVILLIVVTTSKVYSFGGVGGRPLEPLDSKNQSWFIYNLNAGESYNDNVVVENHSDKDVNVYLYPADSVLSTGGGFALKQIEEEMIEMGKWIKLEKNEVFLNAESSEIIPFTITIPENANVGESRGGIVIEKVDQVDPNNLKEGINLKLRTGVRIYNTIPGDIIQKLSFVDFNLINEKGKRRIHAEIKNEGNVSTKAHVKILITNIFSAEILDKIDSNFEVLRGSNFVYDSEIKKIPYIGRINIAFDVYTKLKDGSEKILESRKISFWVIPVETTAITFLVFLIVVLMIYLRRKKYSGKGWREYKVKEGDDIMKIATLYNVDWKLLVKTNRIKEPYFLVKDMTILVPPKFKI